MKDGTHLPNLEKYAEHSGHVTKETLNGKINKTRSNSIGSNAFFRRAFKIMYRIFESMWKFPSNLKK